MSDIKSVTGETFKTQVLESKVPVLVDFYAPWCGPCRALVPILAELFGEANGRYKVFKVNTDEEAALAADFGVSSVPTLMIFTDGNVTAKLVGLQNKGRLLEALGAD